MRVGVSTNNQLTVPCALWCQWYPNFMETLNRRRLLNVAEKNEWEICSYWTDGSVIWVLRRSNLSEQLSEQFILRSWRWEGGFRVDCWENHADLKYSKKEKSVNFLVAKNWNIQSSDAEQNLVVSWDLQTL